MKEKLILEIKTAMTEIVSQQQMELLNIVLNRSLDNMYVTEIDTEIKCSKTNNHKLLSFFIASKKVEGCSDKSLKYYINTIEKMLQKISKSVIDISTNDLRTYLFEYQELKKSSRVTIDNMRRIFSSFFTWLENEDYILKSPVRRIHKVKTGRLVKDILSDEQLEILRDTCTEIRDLAMIELLTSTGMRVGELVKINRTDIDFYERQIVVFGKGNSEREVYFDARTKIHLRKYLETRTDDNNALFVSLAKPNGRLSIGGVEMRLRTLGKKAQIDKVHPHKFRRTLATMAIDKGMPIEQVQKLLGHVKIDTTMHYAMVNQTNVKNSHRKFIG
ncbi:site-specific tyrosine recombinase/integron integrase [Flavobacterium taihuense]|uniref:Tyrosine-type recombinase/integrase n=1 Tax=Flavobacterium taihuense TaxID=2857508 RepID=A0ABS6XWN4_9FLAO|nr:site-specific tyrosine recombinase/integron integrase [Flavobacterium taihuense]MBW4361085.1 tyrosine-type recombinase/integrase [Flavobacterium taihuense]